MAIIGIDLGTTNSLCSFWRNGKIELIPNEEDKFLTPSVVHVNEKGLILVGSEAKERLVSHGDRTAANFKTFMGTEKKYHLGGKTFLPEELSAIILKKLKQDAEIYLGEEVTEAVISVPAYFNDEQRKATKLAGDLAGLKVERLINEPSASALAYRTDSGDEEVFMVFDLGGGTFDISIVDTFENIVEILAITGDNHFGGNDFDEGIEALFYDKYPEAKKKFNAAEKAAIRKKAELCKIALSTLDNAILMHEYKGVEYSLLLDNGILVKKCAYYFNRIKELAEKAVRDSGKTGREIDEIILVGGSTRMPIIKNYLRSLTGKMPVDSIDPDTAVAVGAGIFAGIKSRNSDIKDMILTDICPFSLGIDVYDSKTQKVRFFPMIERNTTLPAKITHPFSPVKDYQKKLELCIYQGESYDVNENMKLGTLEFDLPHKPASELSVMVTFTYDLSGLLIIDAESKENGISKTKIILDEKKFSEEEKNKKIKALRELEFGDSMQRENVALINRVKKAYEEVHPQAKEYVAELIARFHVVLKTGRQVEISKMRMEIEAFLERVEGNGDIWE